MIDEISDFYQATVSGDAYQGVRPQDLEAGSIDNGNVELCVDLKSYLG